MAKEKELRNVPGLNPDDVVVIKRRNYGEEIEVTSGCINTEMDVSAGTGRRNGEKQSLKSNIDIKKAQLMTLVYGIKSGPFMIMDNNNAKSKIEQKIDIVKNLDRETGDFLYNEIEEINGDIVFDKETIKKSEEPSEDETVKTPK